MEKYSKKLVFDYVMGNDIEDFNIDELEDDYKFMMEVIKFSKDKRMYDLCSDKVRNNYEFIKFMVETFKDDVEFVTSFALNYLNNTNEEDITYKELLVIVGNLKGDNDKLLTLKLKREIFKTVDFGRMEVTIDEETDLKVKQELGMGFIFIIDNYGSSDILKKYFAEEFIQRIFKREDITLEELIHKTVKNFEVIEKQGINSFLINFIEKYDYYLATYVFNHIELLDEIKKELLIIGNNWDKYISNINSRRFDILNQEIYRYVDDNDLILGFSVRMLVIYVMKKHNLEDIFNKYDQTQQYIIENEIGIDDSFIDESRMNLAELKFLKYVNDLVTELFKEDVISKKEMNNNKQKYNSHTKILKYNINSN